MTGIVIISTIVVFIATMLISSQYFYRIELRSFIKKVSKPLGLNILELSYSFDQMVYFISLPSNLPVIQTARKEDIIIECEYTSLYLPRLLGIKAFIKSTNESMMLAYLPIKDFRLPKLDQLLEQGKINEEEYLKISTYKLIHPLTLKEISEEVVKQLQVGRKTG